MTGANASRRCFACCWTGHPTGHVRARRCRRWCTLAKARHQRDWRQDCQQQRHSVIIGRCCKLNLPDTTLSARLQLESILLDYRALFRDRTLLA